jgi:hypothetical protein
MAPAPSKWFRAPLILRDVVQAGPAAISQYLSTQWSNPSDILSILLLLGSDVIRAAVSQQSGRFITPVSFSFGWAAYAVSAVLSAVGGMSIVNF